jgi:hypothetical protein
MATVVGKQVSPSKPISVRKHRLQNYIRTGLHGFDSEQIASIMACSVAC